MLSPIFWLVGSLEKPETRDMAAIPGSFRRSGADFMRATSGSDAFRTDFMQMVRWMTLVDVSVGPLFISYEPATKLFTLHLDAIRPSMMPSSI